MESPRASSAESMSMLIDRQAMLAQAAASIADMFP
jgi:hypothetical protein